MNELIPNNGMEISLKMDNNSDNPTKSEEDLAAG